ncbi:MAG: 30S ribosomal protein S6 [Patescibacteria group bacterium]|nr:30S ribosomal protein S6 [Patescibacteria group bacterium]
MNYELLYIISAQYTDDEVAGLKDKVTAALQKSPINILTNENLGKLKLAYPIKHARHGFYILVEFETEPAAVRGLEREIRLMPEVLRHQLISLGAKRPSDEARKAIRMISYEEPEPDAVREPAPRSRSQSGGPRTAPRPAPKKVNLEELDKKLDEILESDVKI